MSLNVYLADLKHNYLGVSTSYGIPVGVGYMKAVMDKEFPEASSYLFTYPEKLSEAIQSKVPDVLFLTNYMWNEQLSLHYARMVHEKSKGSALIVMGGPNFPLDE